MYGGKENEVTKNVRDVQKLQTIGKSQLNGNHKK